MYKGTESKEPEKKCSVYCPRKHVLQHIFALFFKENGNFY